MASTMAENQEFQPNKITDESLKKIVHSICGIDLSNVKRLKSYTDKNFLVDEKTSTRKFLCKVKFSDWAAIDADHINEVIQHLNENNFNVPYPVKTKNGEIIAYATIEDENGNTANRPVQLLKFISGKSVLDMKLNGEDCQNVSWFVGYMLASMHQCLEKCTTTNYGINKQSDDYVWYTENFLAINKHIHLFPEGEMKTVITEFIEQFDKRVMPYLSKLRRGYIHGDFSDSNTIIVSPDILSYKSRYPTSETESIVRKLLGVVDFEECHYGYTVFDLAVCMALMMTLAIDVGVDPIDLARIVLNGYQSHTELSDVEKDVLYWAVASRLVTSLVMKYSDRNTLQSDPTYLTGHSAKCPKLLNMLHAFGYEEVITAWFRL